MAQKAADLEAATVQALLGLSDILGLTRTQRYHALWLFVDKLLPALTSNHTKQQVISADRDESHELPLLLFAVASLLLATEECQTSGQGNSLSLRTVYTAACSALEASFSSSFSSGQLQEACTIIKSEVKCLTKSQCLTTDYLLDIHSKIGEAGLATFKCVRLETCFMIQDLLYASKDYRRSQPLECGGKLLAATIIAAAFAISVPPATITTLPFMSWLSDLCMHPKEVIKAQTEQVLAYLLQ